MARLRRPSDITLAALWGFAEATLFFIVPDVLLTCVAISRPRRALLLALVATLGAIFGGAVVYTAARSDPAYTHAAIALVPAVSEERIAGMCESLGRDGLSTAFVASVTGAPYKILAMGAAWQAIDPWVFLLVSVPARLARFLASVGLAAAIRHVLMRRASDAAAYSVLGGFWLVLYGLYWTATSW
ncbi:MAG: hypothetical protein AB7K52_10215 [Phycisphaerales bacterium]